MCRLARNSPLNARKTHHEKSPGDALPKRYLPQERKIARVGWKEECMLNDAGDEITIGCQGEPSVARYQCIRDYLDSNVKQAHPK